MDNLADAFLYEGFHHKGTHYKPLTAQSLLILEKAGSIIATGGDMQADWARATLDYLFVTSKTYAEKKAALADWDSTIEEFADNFTTPELILLAKDVFAALALNHVGVMEAVKVSKKKETVPDGPQAT